MYNQLQVGRYSRLVRKLLRIVEDTPMPQLQGELTPTLCLEADRPEWAYNAETRLVTGKCALTAVAANYSHVRIQNPADSGMLVVVPEVRLWTTPAAWVFAGWLTGVSMGDPVTWSGGIRSSLDGRWGNLQGRLSAMDLDGKAHTAIYVTASNRVRQLRCDGSVETLDQAPWVLQPGDTLGYVTAAVEVSLYATVTAYERALAADEA